VLVRHVRLATGLVLFAYVSTHLLNHACGLLGLAAMEAKGELSRIFTRWHLTDLPPAETASPPADEPPPATFDRRNPADSHAVKPFTEEERAWFNRASRVY